jgi:nitrogenase subunit NifH
MTTIAVTNPYMDKTYKVAEGRGDIEFAVNNILKGNEPFLRLHDFETGNLICLTPGNLATLEIVDG